MRRIVRILAGFMFMLCCGMITSCGHDTPRVELETNGGQVGNGLDDGQGSGHRPGIGEIDNTDRELKDDVLRVKGTGVNMRYDRGGILFANGRNGSVRIVDLDGADEVIVNPGTEGADSLMTGASLSLNGRVVELRSMKKMRLGEGRIWYKATDTEGDEWMIVLPM